MDEHNWREQTLQQAEQAAPDYLTKALWREARRSLSELDQRMTTTAGRLEGELWDHENW